MRFINDPIERTGADFIAFYSAGRVAQEFGFARVYEANLQQAVQEKEVGFQLAQGQVLLYNHLPFLLPILRAITNENYVHSFHVWVILLISIYLISLIVLSKFLQSSGTEKTVTWLVALSAFLFLPLFFSLMNGQDTAFVFLGAALWLYGLASGNERIAGLGLSLTTVRPHLSLAFAIPMLVSHRRIFFAYALGSSILAFLSVLLIGWEGTRQFIDFLFITTGGEWHGMNEKSMFNLLGLVIRTLGPAAGDIVRAWSWVIFAATVFGLSFLWWRKKAPQNHLIVLTVVLALFTSPHLHFHDLTLLLIPFFALVQFGEIKNFAAIALPIAASLLLLVSNITPILQFTTPYLLMLALAVYPSLSVGKQSLTAPHRS